MAKYLFLLCFLTLSKLSAQNYEKLTLFNTYDNSEEITKNIPLENDAMVLSIYWVHGFMNLTEIRHYTIDKKGNVKKFEENQSRFNKKIVSFKEVAVNDVEKKIFLKHFNKLVKSNFIKFNPKSFFSKNPATKFGCQVDSDMETRGVVLTLNGKQSHYKAYQPYHQIQFCDLINKENLQEFVDMYQLFRFELQKQF